MKRFIFLAVIVRTVFLSENTNAQDYKTAIGLRLGPSSGLSVKHFLNEKAALEGILARRWRGFNLTGLYEINMEIASVTGLNWYYGGGAHVGFWQGYPGHPWFNDNRSYTVLGIDGIIGLEYNFAEVPINLSLDWKPDLNLFGYKGIWGKDVAVSVRYLIR